VIRLSSGLVLTGPKPILRGRLARVYRNIHALGALIGNLQVESAPIGIEPRGIPLSIFGFVSVFVYGPRRTTIISER
jgi:hypothetical protein